MSNSRNKGKPNPFAELDRLRASLPAGPPPAPAVVVPPPPPKPPARAVVRMERAGRRGKEVTVVDKLGLGATELERWCRELKQALGCGGAVEDATIVLQGDLRARIAAVLTAKGIERVTMAN